MRASWSVRLAVPAAVAALLATVGPSAAAARPDGKGGGGGGTTPVNLVVNGGFETGTTAGWTVSAPGKVTVTASAPGLSAGTGRFLLVTGGSGTTVSQTVPTVAGKYYRIGWSVTGGDDPGTFTMGAGPVLVWPRTVTPFEVIISDNCPATQWYSYSQPVRAAGSTLTVRFGFTGATAWGLDEVSVTVAR